METLVFIFHACSFLPTALPARSFSIVNRVRSRQNLCAPTAVPPPLTHFSSLSHSVESKSLEREKREIEKEKEKEKKKRKKAKKSKKKKTNCQHSGRICTRSGGSFFLFFFPLFFSAFNPSQREFSRHSCILESTIYASLYGAYSSEALSFSSDDGAGR